MKYSISFILIIFLSFNSISQKLGISSNHKANKQWSDLITNDTDPKRIIKFDIIPYVRKGMAIGVEHKVGKLPLSYYGYLDLKIISNNLDLERLTSVDFRVSWKSDFGMRYYYNKNSRIKKGKNTNGFSSNYFSMSLLAFDGSYTSRSFQGSPIYYLPGPSVGPYGGYGIQRRLGKVGFVDWSLQAGFAHLAISESVYGYGILNVKSTLRIGLGL
jgi:hypothetical protein